MCNLSINEMIEMLECYQLSSSGDATMLPYIVIPYNVLKSDIKYQRSMFFEEEYSEPPARQ